MLRRPIAECDVVDRRALQQLIAACAAAPQGRSASMRPGAAYLQSEVSEFHDGLVIPGTHYRVVSLLGTGGMGSVYEVEHVELGKRFVLKALHRGLCTRRELVTRLRNEWRALGRLEHPNIVAVTDAGLTQLGVSYFVMERLEGETLMARMRREGRLRVPEALRVAQGLLEALSAAHAIGVIHRDIKPPNLFLTREGGVKLLDFGIAKVTDENVAAITQRGVAVGTPRYMSPEQARGDRIDGRADLYATGLLLYEMIAGRGPFDDRQRDANELLLAHITESPRRLSSVVPEVSAAVDELVTQLLEKDCRLRPPNARDAAERVRALIARYAAVPDTREITVLAGYEEPTRSGSTPRSAPVRARGLPTLRHVVDETGPRRDITEVIRTPTPSDARTTSFGSPSDSLTTRQFGSETLLDATRSDDSLTLERTSAPPAESPVARSAKPNGSGAPILFTPFTPSAYEPIAHTIVDPVAPGSTRSQHSHGTADAAPSTDADRTELISDSGLSSDATPTRVDAPRTPRSTREELRPSNAGRPTTLTLPIRGSSGAVRFAPARARRLIAVVALMTVAGGLVVWALTGQGTGAPVADRTADSAVHAPARSVSLPRVDAPPVSAAASERVDPPASAPQVSPTTPTASDSPAVEPVAASSGVAASTVVASRLSAGAPSSSGTAIRPKRTPSGQKLLLPASGL